MLIVALTSWDVKEEVKEEPNQFMKTAPVQTELHRHLDVSVRTSTLLKLAQERGLEAQSTSLNTFSENLILREPLTDLNAVLKKFTLFQHVLDHPEVLEQGAYEAIEDCQAEGTRQVELRFSPSFVCELSHLKWEDALDGFERGISRALRDNPDMRAGLICIASRNYGVDAALETVEFYLKHQHRFIGIDLAGPELGFPPALFEKAFKKAIDAGAKITVHAGEDAGPEGIWGAIELLGASRIGHGIRCVEDPKLMKYLAKHKICLEMCPTSNWLTQCVRTLKMHPLPKVLRSGIPVSINTDDPGIFGVTMQDEMRICREQMGLTDQEVKQCLAHAANATFLKSC
jgi:adenosine deaminase